MNMCAMEREVLYTFRAHVRDCLDMCLAEHDYKRAVRLIDLT